MSVLLDRSSTLTHRGVAARAGAHRRGEHELLRRRDLELVGWLAEQYGARTDQLEHLLDCGPRTVQRALSRLRDAGFVTSRRLLVGEPAWVIPTSAGLRAAGVAFGVWQPRLGLLAHTAAVNDVRLHIQGRSPESEWIPERLLARERQAGDHLPDGVVLVDGQRVAIEVELTVKSQRRLTGILDELAGRFDTVLYFCAAGPHRQLAGFAESGRWATLGVRELPGLSRDAP
jgi:DNA-binding transcriptional ArsR family regulator